jgi:hypothetical protein
MSVHKRHAISIRKLNSPQYLTVILRMQEVPGTNWAGYYDHGFSAASPKKSLDYLNYDAPASKFTNDSIFQC